MGQIELSESERWELRRLHKQQPRKGADKIKAILLYADGYSRREIAQILLIDDEDTLTRWKQSFLDKKDLSSWFQDNYSGYSGRLTNSQLKAVEHYVESNLITDAQDVQCWLKSQYGESYTIRGVHNILHRLGFSYKKTTAYPSKLNPDEQLDLMENLPHKTAVLFMDAVHPEHNTRPTLAWIKTGTEKHLPTNTARKRININGVYNPESQEVIFRDEPTVNAEASIELFKQVEENYPYLSQIYIICDSAPYYYNQRVQEYLVDSRIELIHLPVYSPNLNLIERLWKFLRKKVINSHFYPTFKEFRDAVIGFLENLDNHQDELRQFIGTQLHLLQPFAA